MSLAKNLSDPVLVWGARGFIGSALVTHLCERGWRVRVLTRSLGQPLPDWAGDVDWVELPAGQRSSAFDRALDGVSVVFNLSGSSGAVASNRKPIESLDSNCRLQLEFLAACERAARAVHVVFASSRLVYGPTGTQAVNEGGTLDPRSIYAAHKLCVEHYHQIASQRGRVSYTICRISNPYGVDAVAPDKGYGFVNTLIQRALAGQAMTLFGDGRQLRDYVYIDDLTPMLRLCAERTEAMNIVINLGYGESRSMRNAAEAIQRVLGGGPIEFHPWPDEDEAVESGDFVMDTSRSRTTLGYSPQHNFEAGLTAVRASCARSVSRAARPRWSTQPHIFG